MSINFYLHYVLKHWIYKMGKIITEKYQLNASQSETNQLWFANYLKGKTIDITLSIGGTSTLY